MLYCHDNSLYGGYSNFPGHERLREIGYVRDIDYIASGDARSSWPYSIYRHIIRDAKRQSTQHQEYADSEIHCDVTTMTVKVKPKDRDEFCYEHDQTTLSVALSRDGKVGASSANDKTVVIYDLENCTARGRLTNFPGSPLCLALDEKGENLILTLNNGLFQRIDTRRIPPVDNCPPSNHIGVVVLDGVANLKDNKYGVRSGYHPLLCKRRNPKLYCRNRSNSGGKPNIVRVAQVTDARRQTVESGIAQSVQRRNHTYYKRRRT